MKKIYIWILCIAILVLVVLALYAKIEKKEITSSVLRLHVVAQSDSKEDQTIKLKVRDAVLVAAEDMFCNVKSKDEAIAAVNRNKKIIQFDNGLKIDLLSDKYKKELKVKC